MVCSIQGHEILHIVSDLKRPFPAYRVEALCYRQVAANARVKRNSVGNTRQSPKRTNEQLQSSELCLYSLEQAEWYTEFSVP
ncbi:hypothetical protein GQ43DRAFT_443704 [Delitschia confertaspora ATCC 74209]|uniref:Uncharacterized protein n=1 Tax=Delitschia confertaspora ATCC 74209 TaxID=1513339 RepID=A0A9P4JHF4_9PLEO|nr:hypothetical protein GQ43DRAFT_443704 [Delitschia confertaspora ATCC 74209]